MIRALGEVLSDGMGGDRRLIHVAGERYTYTGYYIDDRRC